MNMHEHIDKLVSSDDLTLEVLMSESHYIEAPERRHWKFCL
jgi:hypothetical protein